jgi:hypothetical protein
LRSRKRVCGTLIHTLKGTARGLLGYPAKRHKPPLRGAKSPT